jgi:hypothetical protein
LIPDGRFPAMMNKSFRNPQCFGPRNGFRARTLARRKREGQSGKNQISNPRRSHDVDLALVAVAKLFTGTHGRNRIGLSYCFVQLLLDLLNFNRAALCF